MVIYIATVCSEHFTVMIFHSHSLQVIAILDSGFARHGDLPRRILLCIVT